MSVSDGHEVLRRKATGGRVGRPPLRDPDFISDLFARLLEDRLRTTLRSHVVVTIEESGAARLSDALAAVEPSPALYAVAETPTGRLGAVLTLAAPLVHRAVASCTGAEAAAGAQDRVPTAIDEALVAPMIEDIIDCFERAIVSGPRPAGGVALKFVRFVRKTSSLAEAPDAVDTLTLRFGVAFGGYESEQITLIIPLGALDIYRAAEKTEAKRRSPFGQRSAAGELWASAMISAANIARFRLVGVLAELTMTVGEVEALAPGDVLELPASGLEDVRLRIDKPGGVAGEPDLAEASLGAAGHRRALRIVEPPAEALIESLQPYILAAAE